MINPRLLAIAGALGLSFSWGCFEPPPAPPVPIAPTTPSPSYPDPSILDPARNRDYKFELVPIKPDGTYGAATTQQIDIVGIVDDTATYDMWITDPDGSVHQQPRGQTTKKNGVFWVGDLPNPVTKDINSYPVRVETTVVGPILVNVVTDATGSYSFAHGVLVAAATKTMKITLKSVQ